ncbi:MAG: hypothetical protein JWP48_5751 [Actinoallomurus sp.]|jgi:hypothetical protein|nr:hypothetical protein [Actinoallomurus sp.]
MKMTSSTLLAVTGTAGVVVAQAFLAPAPATPGVHLVTSIQALSRAPDAVRYAVTVRPAGGAAHAVTLVLSTRRPATWTTAAPACMTSGDRTAVACDLGDVRESETRTLRVTARPGPHGPSVVPVVLRAGAANAPSVTASLDAARTTSMRLTKKAVDEPSPGPSSPEPAAELASSAPDPSPDAQSPAAPPSADQSPPIESPSAEPGPLVSPGVPSPEIRSDAARPSWSGAHRPPRTHALASPTGEAHGRPPSPPHAPIIPHAGLEPEAPAGAPAVPIPGGPIPGGGLIPGGPPGGPPGAPAPATLPQIAPRAGAQTVAKASPGQGTSELDMSPAGALQTGRRSWATLIAIAVVTEAGLLWLVAGFTVLRRRRPGAAGVRVRTRWRPRVSRLLP